MPQCPNGSQPAPGAPTTFWAFDIGWLDYLTAKIPAISILLSPFIQPTLMDVATFCATEPVIPPAPTLTDYLGAFITNPDAQTRVVDYWKAVYLSSIWPTYCVCSTGGAPAGTIDNYLLGQSPAGLWPFDDTTTAASYRDISGHGNREIQNGGTILTPKFLTTAAGTCTSVNENGWAENTTILAAIGASAGPWSFAGFIKTNDTANHNTEFGSSYDGSSVQSQQYFNIAGKLGFQYRNSANQTTSNLAGPTISDNVPHFFVMSWNYTTFQYEAWMDGVRWASGSLPSGTYIPGTGGAFHFFSQAGGGLLAPWIGQAALFGFYNKWFTQSEQQLIMWQAGLSGFPPFIPPAPSVPTGLPTSGPGGFTCTTIADVCAALNILEGKLDNIALLRNYSAPTSIAFGTPTTGLQHSGTFSHSGMLGVEVAFTTIPPGWGRTTDTPGRYIPQLGSIQLEYASGGPYSDSFQLHYNPQVVMFDPRGTVGITYAFKPGVVASITPIVQGP